MSKYYTAKQREKLRVALAISVAAMEVAQAYRKRRIKPQDTAIMYLNAAITELKYDEKSDMGIVIAAWKKSMEYVTPTKKPAP